MMKTVAVPLAPLLCCVALSGCATRTMPGSPAHVTEAPRAAGTIPDPVQQSAVLPPPKATPKTETYSVSVNRVPVQSLLYALARDAGLNVDVHPAIDGMVTLNAIDQTLPQLLNRIGRQVDMRYEIENGNLIVLPDTPVWRNYKVDYVNMSRSTSSSVNIATQISTTGGGAGNSQQSAASGNNNSTTSVNNRSDNNFWVSLEKNIRDLLRENGNEPAVTPTAASSLAGTAQAAPAAPATPGQPPQAAGAQLNPAAPVSPPDNVLAAFGASAKKTTDATSVVVNAEGGLIAVRATGRQHARIAEFMDLVVGSAKRQVMVEATIIEVRLSNQYQQGINWSSLNGGLSLNQKQVGTSALPSGVVPGTSPGLFVINYLNPTSRLGNIATTIQLLESFGKVKVLSSPKISVLNNQTAILKVVDNKVFFSIKVTPAVIGSTGTITTPATYESKLETVPVGFVMSVTPQIADTDEVTFSVRPTITRIVGFVQDPNPALAQGNVVSKVPEIQARELESIMKVSSGQIAVMGGLMQDSVDNAKDSIPGLGELPVIGNLFSYRNENASKTELVIFMRAVVVKDASINGDYRDFRYLLPNQQPLNTEPYTESNSAPARSAAPIKANGS